MNIEKAKSRDVVSAAIEKGMFAAEQCSAQGFYVLECYDKDGNLKWRDEIHNLVVNVGLQDMSAKYFTGSGYTAAWYLGLYGAAASNTPAAGDTASSHTGWTEITPYSNATRPACTFGTPTTANPSVATNSASPASFTINAVSTTTVGGAFLISNSTKGGSTGTLFSASDFTSPGDRSVVSGDTLNVTYTHSLTAV